VAVFYVLIATDADRQHMGSGSLRFLTVKRSPPYGRIVTPGCHHFIESIIDASNQKGYSHFNS
jgi:hypothetical protein